MTEKEQEDRKAYFKKLHESFQRIAEANGLKGKALEKAGFYYLQGAVQGQDSDSIDSVFYVALLRSDVDELISWIK